LLFFCSQTGQLRLIGISIYAGKDDTRDIWWKTVFLVVPKKARSSGSSSWKKIIVYALIGIVAIAAVSVSAFSRPPQDDTQQKFKEQWCGTDMIPNSNAYITEVILTAECEMPIGIAVENDVVWYVSGKRGTLGSYSISENKFQEYTIPTWPTREQSFTTPLSWSMSWSVRVAGDYIWFTDEKNNAIWRFNKSAESFEMFKVPAGYPSDMALDANGNIYLIGINTESLFFGDVSKMKSGTSEGFTEIPLPLGGFEGIDPDFITSGLLVLDKERNDVWVSLLAFQRKGQLFQYDIETNKVVQIVDLPADLSSPVGAALDNSGNLWVADHGTNIFFKYDPINDKITRFTTSIASPKIYGGTTPPNAYTWPYWMATGPDGSIWFNEHIGNKIARFDPEELMLTEYWIPSQNRIWSKCPPDATTCGIANALQLAVGSDNQVWFSEWTENKIARLDTAKQIPLTVSAPDEVRVARGDSTEIRVTIEASGDFSGKMVASATLEPNGMLGNSSGIFSEESISLSGGSKQVSYTFTPAENLAAGQYVIMVGAENNDVSVMKAVKVNII
jgi:virginiamycin B lyase